MPRKPKAPKIVASPVLERADDLVSAVTRIGTSLDQRKSYGFERGCVLTPQECTDLFTFNDLAAIICSVLPEEALSKPFRFQTPAPRLQKTLDKRVEELSLVEKVLDAAVFARVHGDCFLYMVVDDRASEEREPLNVDRVSKIQFLRKVERERIVPFTYYMDPKLEKQGQVQTYMITFARTAAIEVHETRLLKFRGARTADRELEFNNWFDHSVLQRIADVLRDFGITWAAASRLVTQSIQGKYKLKNLAELLAAPGQEGREQLSKRVGLIDEVRGMFNSLILDADAEDFTYEIASFTSLPELLDRFANRLAAAAGGIPVTKLFGVSPAGMNATGDSDQKNWNRILETYRRDRLTDPLAILLTILLSEQGKPEDAAEIVWPPVDEPTEMESAALKYQIAQTDVLYITNQVLSPAQVAKARFSEQGGGFDHDIQLSDEDLQDLQDARDEAAEQAQDQMNGNQDQNEPEADTDPADSDRGGGEASA